MKVGPTVIRCDDGSRVIDASSPGLRGGSESDPIDTMDEPQLFSFVGLLNSRFMSRCRPSSRWSKDRE